MEIIYFIKLFYPLFFFVDFNDVSSNAAFFKIFTNIIIHLIKTFPIIEMNQVEETTNTVFYKREIKVYKN